MKMQCHANMSVLSVPHQKRKTFATYRWCTHSPWQFALILMVSSNETTYAIMISIPTEEHNIHIWHTSPLIPQVASTLLTLCGQRCIRYKNVFTSWGRDQKTSIGPHALGARTWLVAWQTRSPYHTIGTIIKQASSWGDRSKIHITRREETYILTFSSVHRYRKVNCIK
jgi:hypothetical protein